MATEAKEKGTRSPHFNLVFLLQIRGHFMYKIHVAVHNNSIWIVRARKAPDNFRCVEFKMEIDQVLICICSIKNSRDKIDKNGVFKLINLRFVCLKTLPVTVLKTNFITAKNQGSLFIRSTKSVHMSSTPHSACPMILPVYILYTNMWPELEDTAEIRFLGRDTVFCGSAVHVNKTTKCRQFSVVFVPSPDDS